MFLDAIRRLYDYQREVNSHILDVAERVTSDEFTAVIIEGQPSIRDTLVHLIDVVQTNVSWWDKSLSGEDTFAREFPVEDFKDISSLKIFWKAADADVSNFIDSLTANEDLERVYVRTTPSGEVRTRLLWEMMLHVLNHGTQHRSEVAVMLTKLGHSPGDMEIL
jgi:uncharacterized damage-inducible protein DinB